VNTLFERLLLSVLHRTAPDGTPVPHGPMQRLVARAVTALFSAPHRHPFMEWQYGPWIGVFAARDEWGRQLGEANVYPQWLITPLRDDWRPFQGPGCRRGHPFNVSALRQVTQVWEEILLDVATLKDVYCRRHHREGTPRTARDLYVLAAVTIAIPGFLLRRGNTPVRDGAVPVRAAAAFKVLGGVLLTTASMVNQGHLLLTRQELSPDDLLQYVEDEHLLLSPEVSRACAAPAQMIRQLFTLLIEPSAGKPTSNALPHLGTDLEQAFTYGELCARIELSVLLQWRILGYYLQPLLHHSCTPVAVRHSLLQEPSLGLESDTSLQAFSTAVLHVLRLFESPPQEQQLLGILLSREDGNGVGSGDGRERHNTTLEDIGANCYRIELAMRALILQQQPALYQLLRRRPPKRSADDWSPSQGSSFLQGLFRAYPRLALSC